MEQKDYWNSVAEDKEFTTSFFLDAFRQQVDPTQVILDFGCGYGRTLEELHQNGYAHLIGVDFSERLIERGQRLFPYLDLRTINDLTLDFPQQKFDAVILLAVLTCLAQDEDQKRLIQQIHKVLKPNGVLYINDFLINTDERNRKRYSEAPDGYPYGVFELPEGALLRHHDKTYLDHLLEPFRGKIFEKCVYKTMNGHESNGFYYIGMKK